MASIFGGGGGAGLEEGSSYESSGELSYKSGIYSFGGNVGFYFGNKWQVFINGGGGMAGPGLTEGTTLYPFIRGSLGLMLGSFWKFLKIFFDYNLFDNGYRAGVLFL
jgi:hypothetical protein